MRRYICGTIYPKKGRAAAPPEVLLFLFVLGVLGGVVGTMLELLIDMALFARNHLLEQASDLQVAGFNIGRAGMWIGTSLCLCWLAIYLTGRIAPQAAGSGIPEMKSILSGGMKSQEASYLSLRTLTAKVLGLACALSGGLPLGKEGPFVHISCCLVVAMLKYLPFFASIRRSKPLRLQMFAVGCAVGVSSTFGAPIGGVLFSIEVTAQYFLVKLYWRCFFAALWGAITARLLFSIYHSDEQVQLSSMIVAHDVGIRAAQVAPYFLIGLATGYLGVVFVRLNQAWMRFRKRHARAWALRHRFAWSTAYIVLWSLVSLPEGPFGSFMHKGQLESINELFSNETHTELGDEWRQLPGGEMMTLSLYVLFRFSFLVLGITLPLPCGVFAPCLAIGAGVGRLINVLLTTGHPAGGGILGASADNAGGYAVLGAAAMAAGTTRTISSAILIFELTGGLTHVLPVLISVVVAYVVGEIYSVSVFDSILQSKGLITMPELHVPHKTARDVMLVRSTAHTALAAFRARFFAHLPLLPRCFKAWRQLAVHRRSQREVEISAHSREACTVYEETTYDELEIVLGRAHADDEYFPYLDRNEMLLGVLHRSTLLEACMRRRQRWEQNFAACRSQMAAASRAYGAFERAVTGTSSRPSLTSPPSVLRAASLPSSKLKGSRGGQQQQPSRMSNGDAVSDTRGGAAEHAPSSSSANGGGRRRGGIRWSRGTGSERTLPFTTDIECGCEDINPIMYLGAASVSSALSPSAVAVQRAASLDQALGRMSDGKAPAAAPPPATEAAGWVECTPGAQSEASEAAATATPDGGGAHSAHLAGVRPGLVCVAEANGVVSPPVTLPCSSCHLSSPAGGGSSSASGHHGLGEMVGGPEAAADLSDAQMPPASWMDVVVPRKVWEQLGLDAAPFCVQAEAPMHLVHFYFSQLTLNCVFVTDRGQFVGMINRADMIYFT